MNTETFPYYKQGEFGFTNDERNLKAVMQFRDAAVADGWSIRPTYSSEDVSRACTLERDGFKMLILTRDNRMESGRWKFNTEIHMWAPDRLAVAVPPFYDFEEIVRRTRTCASCKAENVDTQRYSFAGRCCAECLPKMRAATEGPGWCN